MAPVTRSLGTGADIASGTDRDKVVTSVRLRSNNARQQQKANRETEAVARTTGGSSRTSKATHGDISDEPPRFVIDLSLPPEERYLDVCAAFQDQMLGLTALFDEVVGGMVPYLPVSWLRTLCRVFLRRVYDIEENAELIGISQAVGIDMYLLVCFNVLLDLMMGCSSGGARVRDEHSTTGGSKMLHFRTLDWDMPALRKIVIQLDFCPEKNAPVIASSITYAGFVGILTGVRPGLSLSLNFRPNRFDNGRFWSDCKYYLHMVLVLLGLRASISSVLRGFLLPRPFVGSTRSSSRPKQKSLPSFAQVIGSINGSARTILATTACYLCFCNGQETAIIEKDLKNATLRTNRDFIVVTNCDSDSRVTPTASGPAEDAEESPIVTLSEVIADAKEREQCATDNWERITASKGSRNPSATISARHKDVVKLVEAFPTTNECTHFACVLDPTLGEVSWCRRYQLNE